ncbi:MAG: STAS domain-containing protein [Rhodopseudomonas palustris]|nr:STAS domain-containing protein [Rhodopseudomonas palustris]
MDWKETINGQEASISFSGKLTFENSSELRDKVKNFLSSHEVKTLIFDLADVKFVDSSGLGLLVSIKNTMTKRGGVFMIKSVTDTVRKIMKQTGLDKYFDIG